MSDEGPASSVDPAPETEVVQATKETEEPTAVTDEVATITGELDAGDAKNSASVPEEAPAPPVSDVEEDAVAAETVTAEADNVAHTAEVPVAEVDPAAGVNDTASGTANQEVVGEALQPPVTSEEDTAVTAQPPQSEDKEEPTGNEQGETQSLEVEAEEAALAAPDVPEETPPASAEPQGGMADESAA
ncbi:hypothetical protein HY523_02335 [Candidatus Berkelbacteria bacterium]|nr:hypothetical protein [Candidatus Berkelbacteria bacterium]